MRAQDKASAVLRLIKQSPQEVVSGAKVFLRSGYKGLSEHLYDEVVKQDILEVDTEDDRMPGSETGSIKFSIIMPVYNVDPKWLEKAVESIANQIYANWELCIADDKSTDPQTTAYLKKLADNPKIHIAYLDENSGISIASNTACLMATGDYLIFMDNDDVLARNALLECYYEAGSTLADVIYSDQDEITVEDEHINPLYKPNWSPDLLLSQMYIGHLLCIKKSLFDEVGGFRKEYDGSQDYDLMLRCAEKTDKICHIDKVLYSWRTIPSSTSANPDAKPYSQTAGLRAIQDHFNRISPDEHIEVKETDNLFVYDVRYPVPADAFASIIIPTKDHYQDLKTTIDSILDKTVGISYEIIILDNQSKEVDAVNYLAELGQKDNIRVIDAPYAFNWSQLNNQGIEAAKGNVIVCLNNDVVIREPEWLLRLAENALRNNTGVVGGLLLYPDGTIQHAGVVVGMNEWADHVYKATEPIHKGTPFISPLVKRNVLAVTGACMAFSRDLYDEIGGFDESFIVCGSDVELGIRAHRNGYYNVYDPNVVLTHYESKTRDAKQVPENDFTQSFIAYSEYREAGDPFFNNNLDKNESTPTVLTKQKRIPKVFRSGAMVEEARSLHFRKATEDIKRLNIMLPSIREENLFGGITTALNFFEKLGQAMGCSMRIIVMDTCDDKNHIKNRFPEYVEVDFSETNMSPRQIIQLAQTDQETLEVGNGDIFVFTIWWGAFRIQTEYAKWDSNVLKPNPFIYLIQDFEPGFYPWSTRYVLAESTYQSQFPQIAVYNSKLLCDYFAHKNYDFVDEYYFEPRLNKHLKQRLVEYNGHLIKRKRILVYGRPKTDRNAFELIVEGLREWVKSSPASSQWEILGAGESFKPVYLGRTSHLTSLGKLSLDDYATVLASTYAGISLMVSPHPSYPPLEMAAFGASVITNSFSNKDLSDFSENMISIHAITPQAIARELDKITMSYHSEVDCKSVNAAYLDDVDQFAFIDELVKKFK